MIGDQWITDLDAIAKLRAFADDDAFRLRWRDVKQANKERLGGDGPARMRRGIRFGYAV